MKNPYPDGITVITQVPSVFSPSAVEFEIDIWTSDVWSAQVQSDRPVNWIDLTEDWGEVGYGKIKFSLSANTGFDSRSTTILITAGEYTKEITVTQNQNNSISVSASEFTVPSTGQRIEIEVASNLDYDIIIPDDATWITRVEENTKALERTSLKFDAAANDTYMPRHAVIVLRTEEEDDVEITVNQLRNVDLLVSQPDTVRLNTSDTTFVMEISTNLEYTVSLTPVSWLTMQEQTRALVSASYVFTAEEKRQKACAAQSLVIEADSAEFSRRIIIEQSGPNDERLALERNSLMTIFRSHRRQRILDQVYELGQRRTGFQMVRNNRGCERFRKDHIACQQQYTGQDSRRNRQLPLSYHFKIERQQHARVDSGYDLDDSDYNRRLSAKQQFFSGLLPHKATSIENLRYLNLTNNKLRDGITPDFMTHKYFKSWSLQPQKSGYAVTEQWDDPNDPIHADGEVEIYQKATKGKGVNIFLTCDGYTALNNSVGGTAERRMKLAAEAFFAVEPYKSLRDYFNIYIVYAHSQLAGISINGGLSYSRFGAAQADQSKTNMSANCDYVFSFVVKATGIQSASTSLIMLVANSSIYGGTCWMYATGGAVGITPACDSFEPVLRHECGGHGFAKLADEYFYSANGRVTESAMNARRNSQEKYGWYQNADFTDDPEKVLWSRFLKDSRYEGTVGIYEGAFTYYYGAYRPTNTSIMRSNTGVFNAPSRESIYKNIMSKAFDDWTYDYEEFVEFDIKSGSISASAPSLLEMVPEPELPPLGEPVVIDRAPIIE
ncbi:MAG: M64 family metallo-endopeptidase [Alistipes putredinis]|nr:MAG: M64 family metallo-endopeptidase [Alistipes putredinis]